MYIIWLVLLDQITKYLFYNQNFLNNFILFKYHTLNQWISWWLKIMPFDFLKLATIIILWAIYWFYKKWYIDKIAFTLIFAWWIWNLIDRFFLPWVRDFITIPFIHFPTFNVADMLVTFWAIWIIYKELKKFWNK